MGFTTVMLKKHAGGTVQLRHNDALSTVNDERAGIGHERHFAHVDFLLLEFLDRRLGRFLVHDDQTHLGAQGRGVGQTTLLTFLDIKHRRTKLIAAEFQARHFVMAFNREYRRKGRLQAFAFTLGIRRVGL